MIQIRYQNCVSEVDEFMDDKECAMDLKVSL